MNPTTNGASRAQIELDKLEALARAADPDGVTHLVTHYRDHANVETEEAWRRAATPAAVLELIALARAGQQAGEAAENLSLRSEVRDLRAQLASVQRDAARYRYLRNPDSQPIRELDVLDNDHNIIEGRALDAALDAAGAQLTNTTETDVQPCYSCGSYECNGQCMGE